MTTDKNLELITQCCVCKEYKLKQFPEYWISNLDKQTEKEINKHPLSRGYCPICFEKEMIVVKELNKYKRLKK